MTTAAVSTARARLGRARRTYGRTRRGDGWSGAAGPEARVELAAPGAGREGGLRGISMASPLMTLTRR
ncbi:hypothetical protein [Streptomyces fuscichromogenes]|uniref:Uncharacterized protein n=1 Tax=Streptomyces fuscichromogenes TaxID=1324013 RepID=A0A917XL54_9ACTN|nr:hypothetical protein [Streptomyces fuscichromogenes]GGN36207.1 hypothetical protein GCM10011578_079150 [Streptomyces fuscichromogenes]